MSDRACRYCGLTTLLGRCTSMREADRCAKNMTPLYVFITAVVVVALACGIGQAFGAEPRRSYAAPKAKAGSLTVRKDPWAWDRREVVRERGTGIVRAVCVPDRYNPGSVVCRWIDD